MELQSTIVDPIHIFDKKKYVTKKFTGIQNIHLIVEHKDTHEFFYFVQKGKNYNSKTKYSFINYLERSMELIHPSIINLSGYSIEKPYLYYKFSEEPLYINNIKLSTEILQKIFIGIASGLSYLSYKGYYFTNFSINSIIFDKKICPKFIDYIDFDNRNNLSEKDMVIKYAELVEKLLKKKIDDNDSETPINTTFKSLIERCHGDKAQIPTFSDFINFFEKNSFRGDSKFVKCAPFQRYIEMLNQDKFIFDEKISKRYEEAKYFDSIEQICYYFFKTKIKKLSDKDIFLLNSLPEYYIKPLYFFCKPLSKKISRYVFCDDVSLIIHNWREILKEPDSFKIYKLLMKEMNIIDKQRSELAYLSKESKQLSYKIEAIRIQAIHFLKEASKQTNEAKIELAVQYIKGDLLAINFEKASKILGSISNADSKTNKLVTQMISKMNSEKITINKALLDLSENNKKIVDNANKNVLYMLYLGFAFYTGFNGFPIIKSLSIEYYKKAAKNSPEAMTFLGYLYINGIFFPQNIQKARKCFKCAADNGSLKGEIIDSLTRKHVWRSYLADFSIKELMSRSMKPNDTLDYSKINYLIDKNLAEDYSYEIQLEKEKGEISFYVKKTREWTKNIKPAFSEKILLSSENIEDTSDVEEQMKLAISYFNGENGYPVNFTKAAEFFKLAAENGDSEAQWRYALLCINSLGVEKDVEIAEQYLQESAKQNNLRGKYYYALFVYYNKKDLELFSKIIKECYDSNFVDAIYCIGFHFESLQKEPFVNQSIQYYKEAADQGHIDSLIRLIKLLRKQDKKADEEENSELSYTNYLELSVGILDENFLLKLIKLYDESKNYAQSNILIQIGVLLNHKMFNIFYIDSLLNGKGMDVNLSRAKKLAMLELQKKNLPSYYAEKLVCIMLQIFVRNGEHNKAYQFLMEYKDQLTKDCRDDFHLFYEKFDKNLAKLYHIPACFYYKSFRMCHTLLMDYFDKKINSIYCYGVLLSYAKKKCDPFAMAVLGKVYKQGIIVIRSLRKAIKLFAYSADKQCVLGLYYLGKEYYYGRYLEQNLKKAIIYLVSAIEHDEEPRAGYYIYKILCIDKDLDTSINRVDMLKIGVKYGHKRALFKYGELLYNDESTKEEGKKLIQQSCNRGYKKARRFCYSHRIVYKSDDKKSDSNIQEEDKDYAIIKNKPNLNEKKTLFNFALITLDEDDKNDNIVINDQDELSIDELSSINENSSIINIEEDYYSSSEDNRSSNKEDVKEKNDTKNKSDKKDSKLYNIENDKKFRDLNKIKSDDDDFFDFDFWDK